ncbi:PD-(D/E)XK nuclease family protein [Heyndrickxia oleronia]|uniref:PD-(D/E)XK nuclease family protein n=1 Tax=Heyndrickxia oleronia TaxID=38875 RepID=UPI003F22CA34
MNEEVKKQIEELRGQGKKVYSFSKLGTMNTCEYEYHNTYNLKKKGLDNIYNVMGSELHSGLEGIYGNNEDVETLNKNFEEKLIECEMLGINFPNQSIGDSWKADMRHFLNNFKKLEKKMIQEKLILFKITDDIYLQGYIDSIIPSDKGKPYVNIIDWKTSSKFTGKKLTEAGRQLLLYKVGLEATTNIKVDKVMWCMLKYLYVCNMQKNGKVKKKMCNRGKWVKEMRNAFEKELNKLNLDEFEIELLLDKAVEDNQMHCLPKEIKDKFWLEDCFLEYEVTDERIDELKQYVIKTVKEIESKDPNNEDEWQPQELNKYNTFYCSTLCGHRKHCKFYKAFLDENSESFDKKNKKDEIDMDNLFG